MPMAELTNEMRAMLVHGKRVEEIIELFARTAGPIMSGLDKDTGAEVRAEMARGVALASGEMLEAYAVELVAYVADVQTAKAGMMPRRWGEFERELEREAAGDAGGKMEEG